MVEFELSDCGDVVAFLFLGDSGVVIEAEGLDWE